MFLGYNDVYFDCLSSGVQTVLSSGCTIFPTPNPFAEHPVEFLEGDYSTVEFILSRDIERSEHARSRQASRAVR